MLMKITSVFRFQFLLIIGTRAPIAEVMGIIGFNKRNIKTFPPCLLRIYKAMKEDNGNNSKLTIKAISIIMKRPGIFINSLKPIPKSLKYEFFLGYLNTFGILIMIIGIIAIIDATISTKKINLRGIKNK